MDHNDTEYSMCFINSVRINTLAGNLSVSQSYASLNFIVITVDSSSKFSTQFVLEKHFQSPERLREAKATHDGIDTQRGCLICKMQIEQKLFCFCTDWEFRRFRLRIHKGHRDDMQTSLEKLKNIHGRSRFYLSSNTLTIIAYRSRKRWHLDPSTILPRSLTHLEMRTPIVLSSVRGPWCLS